MGLTTNYLVPPEHTSIAIGGQDEDRFIPGINNQTDSFLGRIIAHFSQVNDHHAFRRNMLVISMYLGAGLGGYSFLPLSQ